MLAVFASPQVGPLIGGSHAALRFGSLCVFAFSIASSSFLGVSGVSLTSTPRCRNASFTRDL